MIRLLVFLWLPVWSLAQSTAAFETTIYFEDGNGHRDSIVVGHDENANNNYNPDFGEAAIILPWDSIFEVRAAHFLDWQHPDGELLLSKKIIGSNEGGLHPTFDCLWVNEAIIFFVNAEHLPIKINWDQVDFSQSYCLNRSTLTPHMLPLVSDFWFELGNGADYSCMAESNQASVDQFYLDDGFDFFLLDEVVGKGVDTIAAILLNFRYQGAQGSPCTAIVATKDQTAPAVKTYIYPNPSSTRINFSQKSFDSWVLLSQSGQLIDRGSESSIEIKDYHPGWYWINFLNNEGSLIASEKFLKID